MSNPVDTPSPPKAARKAHCSKCGGIRNCEVRGSHIQHYSDDTFWASTDWQILECRGCENVFVQTLSTDSENYDHIQEQDGSYNIQCNETARYWPALSRRQKPEWMSDYGTNVPNTESLDLALIELYRALDSDIRMLAAIGIRTTYDIASELLGIDPNLKFGQKLDALINSGKIGVIDKTRIELLVDAGSASAHRGWCPSPDELATMMDILEHFIHTSFVEPARRAKLDSEASRIKETVPQKNPTKQAKGKVLTQMEAGMLPIVKQRIEKHRSEDVLG